MGHMSFLLDEMGLDKMELNGLWSGRRWEVRGGGGGTCWEQQACSYECIAEYNSRETATLTHLCSALWTGWCLVADC